MSRVGMRNVKNGIRMGACDSENTSSSKKHATANAKALMTNVFLRYHKCFFEARVKRLI